MAGEIKKAGLTAGRVELSFGELAFLRSAQRVAPYKEAVLMLHGAAAANSSWIRFSRALGSGLPQLIPDLPGHGMSVAGPDLAYGIGAQATRVAEFLAFKGVARVHVIASSMGGAIALRLAADQPALVASLVLIGAVGMQADESWLQRYIGDTGNNPMLTVRDKPDYQEMLRIGMAKPPAMPCQDSSSRPWRASICTASPSMRRSGTILIATLTMRAPPSPAKRYSANARVIGPLLTWIFAWITWTPR